MFDELIRRWWIVAGRGAVAVALGVWLFVGRVEALGLLVSLFGVFALADGLFTVGAGLAVGWLPIFLEGIVGMAVGAFTFLYPPATELWFVQLIVLWALATGVLELVGVLRLRRVAEGTMVLGEWLLALSGVASIVFGVVFALRPGLGALTGVLGVYAIISGVLLLVLALNVRQWPHVVPPPVAA
ncbi:MAG TPA: DUF308 domain-containing protein [Vicinamibacterales bacterium]|nr:DUF308 domain-containing protein [Vicinamibacterales bacterium]